jgi:hypothetical protein
MEEVPKETETIAVKRSARLKERFRQLQEGLKIEKAWWNNGPLEVAIILFLFFLNFYLIYPFFGLDAFPTKYSGPVIPLLSDVIEKASGIPMSKSLEIVTITFLLFFPLTYYLFVKKLSGRKVTALIAVLVASLPFYPFVHLRIDTALLTGDGPHIASISVIPLALYGLLEFLRNGGVKGLIISAVASAVVALTSPFGVMTFLIFAVILLFSEVLVGNGRLKIARFTAVMLTTGGLCSFWYNPVFFYWMITGPLGADARLTLSNLIPISLFTVPVLATLGYLLFDRKPKLQPVFLASFFTIGYALIVVAGGGFVPSHPSRYISELGISLSFFIAISLTRISDYVKTSKRVSFASNIKGLASNGFLAFFTVVLVAVIVFAGGIIGNDIHQNVLGSWSDVDKGDLWVAKGEFEGAYNVLGYTITGFTVFFTGMILQKKRDKIPSKLS